MGDTEFIAWEHQSDCGTRPCNQGTAIREISRAHELMSQLQTLLLQPQAQPGGWPQEEAGDIVRESLRLTASALSALRSGTLAVEKDKCRRECTRRPSARNRRKDETESWRILTDAPYVDGYEWRKYGQKVINNAKYPRSYYRCTFKELGCMARKTVQQEDSDGCPPCFTVEYSDEHTCKRGYSETPVSFVFESSSSSEQVCPVPLHAVGVGGGCGINNNTTPDFESLNELLFQYYEPQIFYTDQSSNNAPPPFENDEMRQGGEVGGAPDCLGSIVFGCHRP